MKQIYIKKGEEYYNIQKSKKITLSQKEKENSILIEYTKTPKVQNYYNLDTFSKEDILNLRNFLGSNDVNFDDVLDITKKRVKNQKSQEILISYFVNYLGDLTKITNMTLKKIQDVLYILIPKAVILREIDVLIAKYSDNLEKNSDKSKVDILRNIFLEYEKNDDLFKLVDLKYYELLVFLFDELKKTKETKKQIETKLFEIIPGVAPCLCALLGELFTAKFISEFKSLEKLAKSSSTKIQIMGAENAMFRHLTKGARTPKYGILYEHPLVSKSKDKGKAARVLANKIAISARIDYYNGNYIKGYEYKEELDEKN
jgi:nucleolar protein 56